jgi:membrane protease subunit HflK
MPWDNHSGGGRRDQQPDLEKLLKRSREGLKQVVPGGAGPPGLLVFLGLLGTALIAAYFAFFFTVRANEVGVVLRFGKFDRAVPSGLHVRLPYPIEEVKLARVTDQNIIEIGYASAGGARGGRDVATESVMLTGDENIVVVGLTVFWKIKDAQKYLFNIQRPVETVKEVAESAMREVVGQSEIKPLITEARTQTELAVQKLIQEVLDYYGAGIVIDKVTMQKSEPPERVIDAFRDVQAAQADKAKFQNEAYTYANKMVPEARGEAERIVLGAQGYQQQAVAEATGQTARFLKVYEEYKKAPEVTRKRLYLETMERVLGGAQKIILDSKASQGVVPYLPLGQIQKRKEGGAN